MKKQTSLIVRCANTFICILAVFSLIVWTVFMFNGEKLPSTIRALLILGGIVTTVLVLSLLKLPEEKRVNVSLAGFVILGGIYFIEIILTLPINVSGLIKKLAVEQDNRSGAMVMRELRANGVNAYVADFGNVFVDVQGRQVEIITHGLISKSKIVLCKEGEGWQLIDTDRFGFRNPDALWDEPNLDIVAVGDSYIHGHCLKEGIAERIRDYFPRTLNLGRSSTSPTEYLARLAEYLSQVSPKYVLWFHLESNDIPIPWRPTNDAYLTENFSFDLVNKQDQIDKALKKRHKSRYAEEKNENHTLDRVKNVTRHYDFSKLLILSKTRESIRFLLTKDPYSNDWLLPPKPTTKDIEYYQAILRSAKVVSAKQNAKVIFVYIPHEGTLRIGSGNKETAAIRSRVLSVPMGLGIQTIDLTEMMFSYDPDKLYDRRGWHPNANGAQHIADYIYKQIGH